MNQSPSRSRSPWWRSKVAALFGIDPRSLALFRIAAALILLYDQCLRLSDLHFFYTDGGIAPVSVVRGEPAWNWSLHFLDGSPLLQTTLFALAMVFSCSLLVGYRTWLSTFFCWLLLASVQSRVPLVGNGGDLLLRLMLFWGLFAPLGRCWSVDAWLRARRRGDSLSDDSTRPVVSIGTAAMLLQVCFMYLFTAIYKWNADWLGDDWTGGEALQWSMRFDYFALPAASYLAQFPDLLRWLALGTVLLELLGPIAVFFPWQTGKIRVLMILAFAALHAMIQATLTVGIFSAASMMGWLLFLPPGFWNHAAMQTVLRWIGAARRTSTEPLPTAASGESWNWRRLGGFAWQAVCAVLLLFVLMYNIRPIASEAMHAKGQQRSWLKWLMLPKTVTPYANIATLQQEWIMFRYAPKVDGWYVARATLADGEVIDLLQDGRPATDDKPDLPSACFPNQHQRYYFHYLQDDLYARYRQPAAEFLFRRWNESHGPDRQIVRLELQWYAELLEPRAPGGFHGRQLAVVTSPTTDVPDDLDRLLHDLGSDPR